MHSSLKVALSVGMRLAACAIVAALIGYAIGAAAGLIMTWQNNHNPDYPEGSYLWWANFMGWMFMIFAWIPGAAFGLFWGVYLELKRKRAGANI